MPRYVRTRDEILVALAEQRRALRSSASAYDAGSKWEAKRLAIAAYNLLHDGTGRTKSILSQLNLRAGLRFTSTAREIEKSWPAIALVMIRADLKEVGYVPHCNVPEPPEWAHEMQFHNWWEELIYKSRKGAAVTRKNLVFALRSKDGGAHFDGELEDDGYFPMSKNADPRFFYDQGKPILNAHLASMRQISWEIEKALEGMPLALP